MAHFNAAMTGVALASALAACADMGNAAARFTDGIMTNGAGMTLSQEATGPMGYST